MKKIITIALALSMVCLMLCSCSSKQENEAVNIKFTYDSVYADMDSSIIRAYEALCNAVVNGESEAGINIGMLEQATQLFYTSFPLSSLVDDMQIKSDNSGVTITYKNDADAHKDMVKAFVDKVNGIVSECKQGTISDLEYAVKAYNYVGEHSAIDNSAGEQTVYSTIINEVGNSYTLSGFYEYLLLQKGIKANHIIALNKDGSSRAISGALINGEYYLFDVGAECEKNEGQLLNYFAMTTQDINDMGFTSLTCTNGENAADSSDLKYDPCRHCTAWEIKDGALFVTAKDGTVVKITQN